MLSSLRKLILVLVLLVVSQPQARAQLNGLEELGHSYQADARGGCEVAVGDTGLAQIRQPASLRRFTSADVSIQTDLHLSA